MICHLFFFGLLSPYGSKILIRNSESRGDVIRLSAAFCDALETGLSVWLLVANKYWRTSTQYSDVYNQENLKK